MFTARNGNKRPPIPFHRDRSSRSEDRECKLNIGRKLRACVESYTSKRHAHAKLLWIYIVSLSVMLNISIYFFLIVLENTNLKYII